MADQIEQGFYVNGIVEGITTNQNGYSNLSVGYEYTNRDGFLMRDVISLNVPSNALELLRGDVEKVKGKTCLVPFLNLNRNRSDGTPFTVRAINPNIRIKPLNA